MGPHAASKPLTLSEQADELEEKMMNELNDKIATKSALFNMGDGSLDYVGGAELQARNPGKYFLMGADPRLPKMPMRPRSEKYRSAAMSSRFACGVWLERSARRAILPALRWRASRGTASATSACATCATTACCRSRGPLSAA